MINENLTMQNKTKKLFLSNSLTLLTHQLQKNDIENRAGVL